MDLDSNIIWEGIFKGLALSNNCSVVINWCVLISSFSFFSSLYFCCRLLSFFLLLSLSFRDQQIISPSIDRHQHLPSSERQVPFYHLRSFRFFLLVGFCMMEKGSIQDSINQIWCSFSFDAEVLLQSFPNLSICPLVVLKIGCSLIFHQFHFIMNNIKVCKETVTSSETGHI